MKFMRKFTCVLCLFSFAGVLAPRSMAQQAAPAPQTTPAQQEESTTPAAAVPKTVETATFHGVKMVDARGKQTDAVLVFNEGSRKVEVRIGGQDLVAIPYDQLDRVSYEYTKKHRVTQGAIVMVASVGAGAIVMLTRSKNHWLYVDFHEQNTPKSLVLRMDKNEYKAICEAVKTHTGKDVGLPAADKEKKEKSDDAGVNN